MLRDIFSSEGFSCVNLLTDKTDCDLVIYQPKMAKLWKYDLDAIKCQKISFPYIFNYGFFILIPWHDGKLHNREALDCHNIQEAADRLKEMKFDFKCKERFDYCQSYLREREKETDIKVADFIEENYHKYRLFQTQNHPSAKVIYYVANEIMKRIGHEELKEKIDMLKYDQFVASPYEIKELNLPYEPSQYWYGHYLAIIAKFLN
jgi:hypothetical protein